MSHEGKIRRGKKWWVQRDNEGNLPEGIKVDPAKMADVNYYLNYLENSKPATPEKKKGGK